MANNATHALGHVEWIRDIYTNSGADHIGINASSKVTDGRIKSD
jgi:hypothetical protein